MLNHGQCFLLAEMEEEILPLVLTDVMFCSTTLGQATMD